MDDELQQLEAELKRLRPVAPRPRVVANIERELQPALPQPRRRFASVHWLYVAALPAAAAIALMWSRHQGAAHDNPPTAGAPATLATTAAHETLKPVAAENVLYAATDEGLVTLADGTTARRARLQFVDTITWKNPRTNASLTWTVPREEVRIIPVTLQ